MLTINSIGKTTHQVGVGPKSPTMKEVGLPVLMRIRFKPKGMPAMFLVYWIFYMAFTGVMGFFVWKARADSPTKTIHPVDLKT
jgi:hypothetical protein